MMTMTSSPKLNNVVHKHDIVVNPILSI